MVFRRVEPLEDFIRMVRPRAGFFILVTQAIGYLAAPKTDIAFDADLRKAGA
jgi:hypothetical protein